MLYRAREHLTRVMGPVQHAEAHAREPPPAAPHLQRQLVSRSLLRGIQNGLQRSLFFFKGSGAHRDLHSSPTRPSPDLRTRWLGFLIASAAAGLCGTRFDAIGAPSRRRSLSDLRLRYEIAVRRERRLHRIASHTIPPDRKTTRLKSSHGHKSDSLFCFEK